MGKSTIIRTVSRWCDKILSKSGDSLLQPNDTQQDSNNKQFSTIDNVNTYTKYDRHCISNRGGSGWWYGDACGFANLNARMTGDKKKVKWVGLTQNFGPSLSFIEMKVRRH